MLNVYPDDLSSSMILPVAHDHTLTIFEWFTYPKKAGTKEVSRETVRLNGKMECIISMGRGQWA